MFNSTLFDSEEVNQTKKSAPSTAIKLTPAMQQWFALKEQEPNALLFFQLGDFYELFFDDAYKAAEALDITLTTRGKHLDQSIPLCGVPIRSSDIYLSRLIRKGFRVAIADQSKENEDGKSVFTRSITRVLTPGTAIEETILTGEKSNILLATCLPDLDNLSEGACAWADISTGLIETVSLSPSQNLETLIEQVHPVEIVGDKALLDKLTKAIPVSEVPSISTQKSKDILQQSYGVASHKALGDLTDNQAHAVAKLIRYLQQTKSSNRIPLSVPKIQDSHAFMCIDSSTRTSLQITPSNSAEKGLSLLDAVNLTLTNAGTRLLHEWLSQPLTVSSILIHRQEAWTFLKQQGVLLKELQQQLKGCPDLSRAWRRCGTNKPQLRDLSRILDALIRYDEIIKILKPEAKKLPELLEVFANELSSELTELKSKLLKAVPTTLIAGEELTISDGFDPIIDQARKKCLQLREKLFEYEHKLKEEFKLSTLKIKQHNQLGFVVETSHAQAEKLKNNSQFILKQGTASLSRFTSNELLQITSDLNSAELELSTLEEQVFENLCSQSIACLSIKDIADRLALIDVLYSNALLATREIWSCPILTDDLSFNLSQCFHPVVAKSFDKIHSKQQFIPNDCSLPPEHHLMLLTGPNMAGKSTFLRQAALCIILAQAGLPVPAKSAEIGIVDKLFSRIGGADDLLKGQSTFMVEMTETASILNQATNKSFVIVDEIGRGTSTSDGLAIAWATLQTLHSSLKVRGIFATHFHELAELNKELPQLQLMTFKIREWDGKVVFQHTLTPGKAEKSWGIHVAKLAGMPANVIDLAEEILSNLAVQSLSSNTQNNTSKFTPSQPDKSLLLKRLQTIDPNLLSPKQAHDILYELIQLSSNEK